MTFFDVPISVDMARKYWIPFNPFYQIPEYRKTQTALHLYVSLSL